MGLVRPAATASTSQKASFTRAVFHSLPESLASSQLFAALDFSCMPMQLRSRPYISHMGTHSPASLGLQKPPDDESKSAGPQ